jgi:hypothetical protein
LINICLIINILTIALIIHSCKKDAAVKQATLTDTALLRHGNGTKILIRYIPVEKIKLPKAWIRKTGTGVNTSSNWDKGSAFVSKGLNFIELPAVKEGAMAFTTQDVIPEQFNFDKSNNLSWANT